MKILYLIIPLLLFASPAGAKRTLVEFATTTAPGTGGMLPPYFGTSSSGAPQKGIYRLVAKTYTEFDVVSGMFVPRDSTTYSFSHGRNGFTHEDDYNNDETVLFDKSDTYFYNHSKGMYDKKLLRTQTYDGDDNVKSVTYTTYQQEFGWKDSARYLFSYEGGKMVASGLEISNGAFWYSHSSSKLQYEGANIKTLQSNLYKVDFDYDNNKLTTVIDEAVVSGHGWQPQEKKSYTYLGDNVSSFTAQKWNMHLHLWENTRRWEYSYDGTDRLLVAEEFVWDGMRWMSSLLQEYSYDVSGNKLTDTRKVWSSGSNQYINAALKTFTYNVFGQPLVITTHTWENGAWAHGSEDYQIRFYYDFPTSVQDVYAEAKVNAYPIPASNVLHLNLDLGQRQPFVVSIVDLQGRTIKYWQEAPAVAYSKSIEVTDLPSGHYILKVVGEHTQLAERFSVQH